MKKSNGRKREPLNRDHDGRWLPRGKTDPMIDLVHQEAAEGEKLAGVYIDICRKIGEPKLAEALDIKKSSGGVSHVGRAAGTFFEGLALGMAFAREPLDSRRRAVLKMYRQAVDHRKEISRIYNARLKLYDRRAESRA